MRLLPSRLVCVCVLLGTLSSADENTTPAVPEINADSVAAFFDSAFSVQRQDHEIAGAVVSVVYEGEVLFKRGYGFADLEGRVPADPDRSLFRIASISKTFVWTALMQLYEQGILDLENDVDRYLDFDIPDTYEEPIRLWHLMTHTPGFEEKGRQHLVAQQRAENVARSDAEGAPVSADLVAHDDAGHHAEAEGDSKDFGPELIKAPVTGFGRGQPQGLQHCQP